MPQFEFCKTLPDCDNVQRIGTNITENIENKVKAWFHERQTNIASRRFACFSCLFFCFQSSLKGVGGKWHHGKAEWLSAAQLRLQEQRALLSGSCLECDQAAASWAQPRITALNCPPKTQFIDSLGNEKKRKKWTHFKSKKAHYLCNQ